MKWHFRKDPVVKELEIILVKESYDQEVADLVAYLEAFGQARADVLPIKLADRISLIKLDQLISVEVVAGNLELVTVAATYQTREKLYKIKERLPKSNFVQVSKQSLININHLQYLEASFSGNMLAVLSQGQKVIVSRRYLKGLEKALGL